MVLLITDRSNVSKSTNVYPDLSKKEVIFAVVAPVHAVSVFARIPEIIPPAGTSNRTIFCCVAAERFALRIPFNCQHPFALVQPFLPFAIETKEYLRHVGADGMLSTPQVFFGFLPFAIETKEYLRHVGADGMLSTPVLVRLIQVS